MTSILDSVAKSHHSEFRPSSVDDYFVLRLATALGEPAGAPHYAVLASQHSQAALLYGYKKAINSNPDNPAPAFHNTLESLNGHGNRSQPKPRMMAIRIERRAVAVALFAGSHLEGWRVRQFPSDPKRAEESCVGFVRDVLDDHYCEGVVVEEISGDAIRANLHAAAIAECREQSIFITEVAKQSVIKSFAHPAPTTRHEVRKIVSQMWLVPNQKGGRDFILDAAALGLYIQTERLLTSNS